MTKVLLAGESWSSTTIHTKGFDSFETSVYEEGGSHFIAALESRGVEVDFLPNHEAPTRFPRSREEFDAYDVIVLSDIGANTLLLPPSVFADGHRTANPLTELASWVRDGGALLMVGGYLSFQGIEAKANYRNTAVADILPVEMEIGDDREETPEGVQPRVVASHPVVEGLDTQWPALLGYQRFTPRDGAERLVDIGPHPLLVIGEAGAGRTAAFASDMGPHWMPREAIEWPGYAPMWGQLIDWLSGR